MQGGARPIRPPAAAYDSRSMYSSEGVCGTNTRRGLVPISAVSRFRPRHSIRESGMCVGSHSVASPRDYFLCFLVIQIADCGWTGKSADSARTFLRVTQEELKSILVWMQD